MKPSVLIAIGLFMSATAKGQNGVFPLEKGDRWVWIFDYNGTHTGVDYTVERDTVFPNGKRYAMHFMDGWMRQSGDSVLIYRGDSQSDILLYNFSAAVGDTAFSDVGGGTFISVLTDVAAAEWFGAIRKSWSFYEEVRGTPDTETWDTIVDSIGIVGRLRFPGSYELVGASISGRTFGTLVGVNREFSHLHDLVLEQNYPNPFNSSTTIAFSCPARQQSELVVFDILGRRILTLFDGFTGPEGRAVRFDSRDLPSGVYWYRLSGAQGSVSRVMILAK